MSQPQHSEPAKQFTEEELKHIQRNWEGKPPAECTGQCNIKNLVFYDMCSACRWASDPGIDTSDNY